MARKVGRVKLSKKAAKESNKKFAKKFARAEDTKAGLREPGEGRG